MLLPPRMSEAACPAFRIIEHLYFEPLGLLVAGNHHLGNPFTIFNNKRFVGKINEDDTNLAAIVGIDGARRIEDGDSFLQSQAAARTYLRFKTLGKCYT